MRLCDTFLNESGKVLGDYGFTPDAGLVEYTSKGNIVVYHYTRQEHIEKILAPNSGLAARLPVVHCDIAPHFEDCYLVEALLEPLPFWMSHCPYFGNFGLEMLKAHVGNVLLRIELPATFTNLYIADTAHSFDCKYFRKKGQPALGLGYDCHNGREVCRADINSYIPLLNYSGGHVAPNVKIVRSGEGIAVPSQYITISEEQPLL